MSVDVWLAFVVAATVVIGIPGPTNLLVMAYTLRRGRRAGLATVFGVLPGVTLAMVLSLAGLGALLGTSAASFAAVKWAGAAYLIYLGIRQWRAPVTSAATAVDNADKEGNTRMMRDAFLVTLLNPKGVVFFGAFFPQFLDPGQPLLAQMTVLGATFLVIVLPINTGYALLAGALGRRLDSVDWRRRLNRAGGSMLIGAGLLTATLRRS
jgi:threonine/homoserine/homoserine lactone efflux protein